MLANKFNGALLVLATFLVACSASQTPKSGAPQRIVTLVPSLANDLFAIGAADRVVGVSKFTENVPAAAALPKISDFSNIDAEKIVALRADEAIGIPSQASMVAPLRRAGIHVTLIRDDSYDDIFSTIVALGKLTGHERQADTLNVRLRARTAQLEAQTRGFKRRPSVFVVLGAQPIWTAGRGSFVGTLIERAGGRNAAEALPQPWGQFSDEALLRAQPDVIFAGPEVRLREVLEREPWRSLRAVREHRIFIIGDRKIVNALYQPGPDYNEGIHWLIERLSAIAR